MIAELAKCFHHTVVFTQQGFAVIMLWLRFHVVSRCQKRQKIRLRLSLLVVQQQTRGRDSCHNVVGAAGKEEAGALEMLTMQVKEKI